MPKFNPFTLEIAGIDQLSRGYYKKLLQTINIVGKIFDFKLTAVYHRVPDTTEYVVTLRDLVFSKNGFIYLSTHIGIL